MTTRLSLNSNDFDCRRQQQPPVVKKRNKKFQKFIFIWGGCNLIKRPSVAFVTLPVALIKATDCVGSLQPLHFSFRLAGKKSSQISDFRAAVRRSLAASWKKNVHAPTVSVNPPRPKKAATVWCYLPRFWKNQNGISVAVSYLAVNHLPTQADRCVIGPNVKLWCARMNSEIQKILNVSAI